MQRLVSPPEDIFLMAGKPVVLRPAIAETERQPRMQAAEKHLEKTAMEDTAKKTVSGRSRPKPVSMPEAELLPGDIHDRRLHKPLHAKLLKVAISPDIMVTLEEIYLHTGINQVLDSSKDTGIPLGDYIPVLVPEIPDVAKQEKAFRH